MKLFFIIVAAILFCACAIGLAYGIHAASVDNDKFNANMSMVGR